MFVGPGLDVLDPAAGWSLGWNRAWDAAQDERAFHLMAEMGVSD